MLVLASTAAMAQSSNIRPSDVPPVPVHVPAEMRVDAIRGTGPYDATRVPTYYSGTGVVYGALNACNCGDVEYDGNQAARFATLR